MKSSRRNQGGWTLLEYLIAAMTIVVAIGVMRDYVENRAVAVAQSMRTEMTSGGSGTVDRILNY